MMDEVERELLSYGSHRYEEDRSSLFVYFVFVCVVFGFLVFVVFVVLLFCRGLFSLWIVLLLYCFIFVVLVLLVCWFVGSCFSLFYF